MYRHYRVILRELVINEFQMQLLVVQFIIKMFRVGCMQVLKL
jgi:hypothetical protein